MVGGFVLGWQSQSPPGLGLLNGHLQPCSDKPNCVSSEAEKGDKLHVIAPFSGTDWQGLRRVIEASGGKIVLDHGAYMHATFTSSLFRFVDDVELRLDAAQELIHVRSASRVGHSDFGVNRERVEAIRLRLGEARP
jgi:uncharacterized protein (DUF1499 family)